MLISSGNTRANSVTNEEDLPLKLTVDAVTAMTAMENRKPQFPRPDRKVIVLPAGAMMTTTVKKPDYVSRASTDLYQDMGTDAATSCYDQFVSVSQVGVSDYPSKLAACASGSVVRTNNRIAYESDDESE